MKTEKRNSLTIKDVRPEVEWFAIQMEEALRASDHKSGWDTSDPDWLVERMSEEVIEVAEEIERYPTLHHGNIRKECADVANFAMMVATCYQRGNEIKNPTNR